MKLGRPRKIKSAAHMVKLWEQYKQQCDTNKVTVHEFSQRLSGFVSTELVKPITYTIEGFCHFVGFVRAAFYEYYDKNPEFVDIVKRIREECELDVRQKFETGQIPTQLSALWMSKYGYSSKTDTAHSGRVAVVNDPYDDLTAEELRKLTKAVKATKKTNA